VERLVILHIPIELLIHLARDSPNELLDNLPETYIRGTDLNGTLKDLPVPFEGVPEELKARNSRDRLRMSHVRTHYRHGMRKGERVAAS